MTTATTLTLTPLQAWDLVGSEHCTPAQNSQRLELLWDAVSQPEASLTIAATFAEVMDEIQGITPAF